jgi:exodeoxyribonuclease V beta subunit
MPDIAYWQPRILNDILQSRHAIIEASAGTGKTFTIEHLFVELLRSAPVTIDQILVVTFTEKATAELRGRIRRLIEGILQERSPVEPLAESQRVTIDAEARLRLERSLWGFEHASIFTIHGFCQRVLTELAFQTGMNFDLEVVDAYRPFHRAFRAVLRECIVDGMGERTLLEKWLSRGGQVDALEMLLLKAHQRRYLESDPAGTRSEFARHFIQSFNIQILERNYREVGLSSRLLKPVLDALSKLQRLVNGHNSGNALLKSLAGFDFEPFTKAKSSCDGRMLPEGLAQFLRSVTELQSAALIENSAEEAIETILVETYLPAIRTRLDRDKREQGLIDYGDMLEWVLRALDSQDGATLADTLRSRFRFGLADEFQDTDDVQWRILKRIFVEHKGDNRLIVVGDPKQAIYGFRGADIYAYLDACGKLSKAGAHRVPLVTNFRSSATVVDSLNYIFDQRTESPFFTGKITYSDPALCGRDIRAAIDGNDNPVKPVVLMRFLPNNARQGFASAARETIGRYIAATLRTMLSDAGALVIQDPAGANHETNSRTVKPRDIFVLTRTKRESEEIGLYLREFRVPFAFFKLDGLFQTREAREVLDVLRAIEAPQDRSLRLRAWGSRFFAVRYQDLPTLGDVPDSHPLSARLYGWSSMGAAGRLADLFDSLIHNSGLVEREILLSHSKRELTNFLHIVEVLLERAVAGRLSLGGIIELLEGYIAGRNEPPGPDGNVQRLESERDAVQVMTVHMSKGLEADVVFLFGGSHRNWQRDKLVIYHNEGERKFAIGGDLQRLVGDELKSEEAEEYQRLLYVALTRARAQLYLPFFPDGATRTPVTGYYKPLNDRLKVIATNMEAGIQRASSLFQIEDVRDALPTTFENPDSLPLGEWSRPEALLRDDSEPETTFDRARREHSALFMSSYTALKHAARSTICDLEPDEFKTDKQAEAPAADLAGGSQVGIFVHEVIEHILGLNTFSENPDFESWRSRSDVQQLFRDSMRLHQVRDPAWFDRGREVVFKALNTLFSLANGRGLGPLHKTLGVREMEFVYPIPERHHSSLTEVTNGKWTVERGFLKGFVDFVFEQDGLIYFADWKSDLLSSYDPSTLEEHVKRNYVLQAQIYLVGIVRLLHIRSEQEYAQRFGGLLYVFLRGVGADADGRQGIYFRRPSWIEVCNLETDLIDLPQLTL